MVRFLRERVTIAEGDSRPAAVAEVWERQVTNEQVFEAVYVAALTMMVWPNSRRIEPGGAFDGSVGPSTSRILATAPTPS